MRERRHELRKEQRWQIGDTENWPGQSRQHTWMLNQSQTRYQEQEKKSSRPLEQDQTSALEKQTKVQQAKVV